MRFVVLAVGLLVAACESTSAPPPPSSPPSSPPAATASAPITAAPATAPATATATSCLMTHICGCNLGCAKIAGDASALREGAHVTPQTGPYAGKDLMIMKETDAAGASVLTLSDRERTMPCELATPQSKSLMGFACAAKDSGPVPAHACAKGCD